MKNMRIKVSTNLQSPFFYLLFVLATFCLCPSYVLCIGSVAIEAIQETSRSIVQVESQVAGLFRTPDAAFRDKETGRLIVARRLKAVRHTRTGAGVIIDKSGLIVTSAHTVVKSSRIVVTLHDGSKVGAKVVLIVPSEDFAFIHITPPYPLTPIQFADSGAIKLGDSVYTVGSSEVLRGTISGGTVTGIGKRGKSKAKGDKSIDLIQTDFSIYKGDSGDPVLDGEGKFLGLMVAAPLKTGHVSFAVPSNKIEMHYRRYLESASRQR